MGKQEYNLKERLNGERSRWKPLTLDYILEKYRPGEWRLYVVLAIWIFLIGMSIFSVLVLFPSQSFISQTGGQSLYTFFMMYPPLFIGTLLLFWLGFEWGFIPVFLSGFLIAYASAMPFYWAILFGVAFILGLAIYGLAYYSLPVTPRVNSIKSIAFFSVVSFLAAIASSLGSFVWSLYHDLSAAESIIIWKGWWTGVFLQSMILVGPLLYFFTPAMERLKQRYFHVPEPKVSINWVYASIVTVVMALSLFIFGGHFLGSTGIKQELALLPQQFGEDLLKANESFQIISYISIGIVMTVGLGGIYLVGTWNRNLQQQVDLKTKQLQESERELRNSLKERNLLLKKIHERVRSNLTIMLAILELQLKNKNMKPMEEILKDSHSRIRSMAIIHETMHQSETVDLVNMKSYTIKLSNRLRQSYERKNQNIDVSINSDEVFLEIDRAVPFAMILNELLVNAYMHAFKGLNEGTIFVEIKKTDHEIVLSVRDNGIGLPGDLGTIENKTLGMKLIRTLSKQLDGEFTIVDRTKTSFMFRLPAEIPELAVNLN